MSVGHNRAGLTKDSVNQVLVPRYRQILYTLIQRPGSRTTPGSWIIKSCGQGLKDYRSIVEIFPSSEIVVP